MTEFLSLNLSQIQFFIFKKLETKFVTKNSLQNMSQILIFILSKFKKLEMNFEIDFETKKNSLSKFNSNFNFIKI